MLSFIFIIFVFYGCKEQKKEATNNSLVMGKK
jgi:hypothetical protein